MILILLMACAAYLYRLHLPSYWVDEAVTLAMSRDWDAMWERLLSYEANMWLYYLQLHFWQQGSQLEFYTRSMSVGFSLLSIAMEYTLAHRLFKNRFIASISAFIMAINPYMLRYAQETRGYSETLFFAAFATYLLIRAEENQKKLWWILYGLAITLGLYLHLFIVWVALAHALWLLSLSKKSWGSWLIGAVVAGAGLLTVGIFQPILNSVQVDWIPPFSMEQLFDVLAQFYGWSQLLALIYSGALILALFYLFKERGNASLRFLWLGLLTPVLATIAISISLKPLFIGRYFIMILAPAAILIAYGAARLPKRWMLMLFMVATVYASARGIYYTMEMRSRAPQSGIRDAYVYLAENAGPDDIIVLEFRLPPEVLSYYEWRFDIAPETITELNLDEAYSQLWLVYGSAAPQNGVIPNYRFVESIDLGRLTINKYEPR